MRWVDRVRLPDSGVFGHRGARLRALSEESALRDYLLLMAAVADAQQAQFDSLRGALIGERFVEQIGQQIELAQNHRTPVLQAAGWPRQDRWREILRTICGSVLHALCERIMATSDTELDGQAELLIAARTDGINAPAAPFIMAALQVYWAAMASTLRVIDVAQLDVPTVCPVCGSLPIASVVHFDKQGHQGYRYLHCGLCQSEWQMARITCSHCVSTESITYHSIEGGSKAVQAETCGKCHTYRKILYQEKDTDVEPVADDLASLALDLLMIEEGFHRGSANPLLWQTSDK